MSRRFLRLSKSVHGPLLSLVDGERAAPPGVDEQPLGATPSEAQKVAASRLAAETASLRAEVCWSRLMFALETNRPSTDLRRELTAEVAEVAYAWAVHHGTVQDADDDRLQIEATDQWHDSR